MLAWGKDFDKAMERLRDYCEEYRRNKVLARGRCAGADLRRHLEVLVEELKDLDPRESLLFGLERDLPGTLRAARARSPKHSQAKAAEEMNVDSETVGSWENGRRRPRGEKQLDVRKYVLTRNGFSS